MIGKNQADIRVKCKLCESYSQTIEPITIEKITGRGQKTKYLFSGICIICNKKKNKTLTNQQVRLLPNEIRNAPTGTVFNNSVENNGEALPLLPLIGAIAAGITALSAAAGTTANTIIQAKKAEEEKRHNLAVEDIAKGGDLKEEPDSPTSNDTSSMSETELIDKSILFLQSKGFKIAI